MKVLKTVFYSSFALIYIMPKNLFVYYLGGGCSCKNNQPILLLHSTRKSGDVLCTHTMKRKLFFFVLRNTTEPKKTNDGDEKRPYYVAVVFYVCLEFTYTVAPL